MSWITIYEDKKKVAEVPDDSEHLLLLHETFKLQKVKNNEYRIRGIRK